MFALFWLKKWYCVRSQRASRHTHTHTSAVSASAFRKRLSERRFHFSRSFSVIVNELSSRECAGGACWLPSPLLPHNTIAVAAVPRVQKSHCHFCFCSSTGGRFIGRRRIARARALKSRKSHLDIDVFECGRCWAFISRIQQTQHKHH